MGKLVGEDRRADGSEQHDCGDASGPVACLFLHVQRRAAACHVQQCPQDIPYPLDLFAYSRHVCCGIGGVTAYQRAGRDGQIGTLLAFVIVCAGVWVIRRRNPEIERPFKTPWVPFVPIMGILISLAMMLSLTGLTWIRLAVWLVIGMVVYFAYGRHHSRVQRGS